jgi:transcriptional regulator with XRE-family HTH domain
MDTAAVLLQGARLRSGLSQAELGRRAGVTQSVVSAYESGARQLSVPALARMVAPTGLQLDLRACEPATIGAPSGALGQRVQARRVESCRAAGRAGRLRVAQPHPAPPLDLFGLDAYTPRG